MNAHQGYCLFTMLSLSLALLRCTPIQQSDRFVTDGLISGEMGSFHGYTMYSFLFDERQCRIVVPKKPAKGNPWLWRARFFGHRPEADLALLDRGFYIAYIDVADLYGSPQAVKLWNDFYELLNSRYLFADKAALEGMSRGGLSVFNWAAENPEKVACIYVDAPVCDIKSWPGGLMDGMGSVEDWQKCLKAYNFTEEEAKEYAQNPVDKVQILIDHQIPLLVVSGDQDQIVPYSENAEPMVEQYQAQGGKVKVIIKKGEGHVHGLPNARPIIQFILKYTREHIPS
ncbi:MAG: prolyl oligopeptidase family serine peptidase [Cyclobacteriaceae bacterium]